MKNYEDEMISLEEQITSARETFSNSRRETEKAGDQLCALESSLRSLRKKAFKDASEEFLRNLPGWKAGSDFYYVFEFERAAIYFNPETALISRAYYYNEYDTPPEQEELMCLETLKFIQLYNAFDMRKELVEAGAICNK